MRPIDPRNMQRARKQLRIQQVDCAECARNTQRKTTTWKMGKRSRRKDLKLNHEDIYDEVDDFNEGKDFVGLDSRDEQGEVSEIDSDIGFEDDSADEYSEGEQAPVDQSMGFEEFEEDDTNEIEEEENMSNAWGNKRKVYYNTDMGEDDQDLDEEELEEVKRIRKKQLEAIDESDLIDDDILENIVARKEHPMAQTGTTKTLDSKILSDFNKSFEDASFNFNLNSGEIQEESIERDLSHLDSHERLELLASQSPELFQFMETFKDTLEKIEITAEQIDELESQRESFNDEQLASFLSKYSEFLHSKQHVYRLFCLNLSFYFTLHENHATVAQDHPVFERLLEISSIIEDFEVKEEQYEQVIDSFEKRLSELEQNSEMISDADSDSQMDEQAVALESDDDELNDLIGLDRELPSSRMSTRSENEEISKYSDRSDYIGYSVRDTEALPFDILDKKNTRKEIGFQKEKSLQEMFGDDLDDLDLDVQFGEEEDMPKKEKVQVNDKMTKKVQFKESEKFTPRPDPDFIEGRRKITYQIKKNKGIMRYRKKSEKNPRKKMRNKFKKAEIKRRYVVREYSGQNSIYSGEKTGIKDSVSRSTRLGN